MQRKINRVAKNTLTISLPSKWVKKNNLKQGDTINIAEEQSTLTVSVSTIESEHIENITFTKDNILFLRSILGRYYKHGATQINIEYKNDSILKDIKNAVNNLMGADITSIENNKCVVKIFSFEDEDSDHKNLFTKMLLSIKYMLTVVNDFNEEYFRELRDSNWKIKDYYLRLMYMKNLNKDNFEPISVILFLYEKIGTTLFKYVRLGKDKIDDFDIQKLRTHIDTIIKMINKGFSSHEETKFRKELRSYQEEALEKTPIVYTTIELLDSSISYISSLHDY